MRSKACPSIMDAVEVIMTYHKKNFELKVANILICGSLFLIKDVKSYEFV